jgi:hypothetical protein
MTFHFEEEALEEYREAVLYAEEKFGVGEDLVAAVEAALSEIERDPERFQTVGKSIRIFRMRRFPYYLFYHLSVMKDSVTIYAFAHHQRRPDYWRHRLPE